MIVEPTAEEINLDDMKVRAPDLNLSCNEVHLHFFHDSRVVNGFEERDFDHHCDLLKFRKNFAVGIPKIEKCQNPGISTIPGLSIDFFGTSRKPNDRLKTKAPQDN